MPQPVSNGGYYRLIGTAAGTVIVGSIPTNFNTYTVGTATTGTVTFYDAATIAGTAAGNQLISYIGSLRDASPNIALKKGLIALVSGTVDALIGVG